MYEYLLDKIRTANFSVAPFKHLYIEDFFKDSDFEAITSSQEINFQSVGSDEALFEKLFANHYQVINFPGCITDYKKYIKQHSAKRAITTHTACESSGIALRLEPKSEMLKSLRDFIGSETFNRTIADKFGVNLEDCDIDGGIQKYLDGYEISPHPDIRRKALTFMVNINPSAASENANHHTHYLRFRPERRYVQALWEGNSDIEREWVPWDWCETQFIQSRNNSIVIFAPQDDTLHAVKADYDHLVTQRTQLYGNLWYKESLVDRKLGWEALDLISPDRTSPRDEPESTTGKIAFALKNLVRRWVPAGTQASAKDKNVRRRNL